MADPYTYRDYIITDYANPLYFQLSNEEILKNFQKMMKDINTAKESKEVGADYNKVDMLVRDEMKKREDDRLLAEKLRIIDSLGSDREDGTVITFTKRFACTEKDYTYAAMRCAGKWFTTGVNDPSRTWEELVAWLVAGQYPVTELTTMVPQEN